jgi:hypothetical protein
MANRFPFVVAAACYGMLGLSAMSFTGCGDYRAESPRHHMDMMETAYDHPVKELPWRPPALGEVHYPRSGVDGYLPGAAVQLPYDQQTHQDQRWRTGR